MSTAEIDFTMNFEEHQQSDADKRLFVVFFREAVLNEFKTEQEGRPIYDDIDMIRIHSPGSRDTLVSPAHHGYTQRFPKQWAQYKAGIEQTMTGTPLAQVPWLTPARVAELRAVNISTVEQLAGMPDNIAARFMDHHALKQQAAAYLEAAKGQEPIRLMKAELANRDDQLAEMRTALEAMQSKVAELTAQREGPPRATTKA